MLTTVVRGTTSKRPRVITWAYSSLKEYRPNHKNVVVGGFSQGGALSIYSAFKRIIPCRGFVAVAPSDWITPESKPAGERDRPGKAFLALVEASDFRGLRGVIMIGEKDPFIPKIQQLYELMVEKGLDGRLQIETGLAHEYPENFGNKLRTAIDFGLETGSKA